MSAVMQRATVSPATVAAPARLRGFLSGAREIDAADMHVEGQLPVWLRGGLLLNGPALWDLPKAGYRHWFDGLAMLHRLQFDEGRVRYRSRFLQTEDYRQSIAAGAPAFAAFDTRDPENFVERLKHFGKPRGTDNAAVVMSRIGGQWFATTEGPQLVGFDPQTLQTLPTLALEDELGVQLMAAHGTTDQDGNYWNVGVTLGPKCAYKLFRLQPGSKRRELIGQVRIPKPGYTHAFAMTPRHALVWETALRAQPLGFLLTGRSYIHNFKWDPVHGSMLHALALGDGSVRSWDVPPMVAFHAIQTYEQGDETVLELIIYDDPGIMDALLLERLRSGAPLGVTPRLMRYRLRARGEVAMEPFGQGLELPQVHPDRWARAKATVAWGASLGNPASLFFDATERIDLASGERRSWHRDAAVQLEPVFVPRPGAVQEDDGVLLVPTLADGDEGSMTAVLDAATMECLAMVKAPQVIPFGFHAAWAG